MSSPTLPKRLIVFPSLGNNSLTLISIMNAIHFEGVRKGIESVVLIYDSLVKKKSNFPHLRSLLKDTKLQIDEIMIPEVNDILSKKIDYTPEDGDCVVVPALPIHLGIILEIICSEIQSVVGVNSMYVCFTKPQGNLIEWYRLTKMDDGTLKIEKSGHKIPFKSNLDWYFESVKSDKPDFSLHDTLLQSIIDSESEEDDLLSWIEQNQVLRLTNVSLEDIGFGFEKLAAACFQRHENIHDIAVNIKFGSERKNVTSREEDIVAIHKNGDLLYISCKFKWCKNIESCREKTLAEVERLKNLQLAFRIPKERITKILVTTTRANNLVSDCIDGVHVTNLAGIDDLLSTLD